MKTYLGDGVYVEIIEGPFGEAALQLTTENGVRTTNTIVLESETFNNLLTMLPKMRDAYNEKGKANGA